MTGRVVRYACFALLATAANLGTQWLFTLGARWLFCPPGSPPDCPAAVFNLSILGKDLVYWIALAAGTIAGFLLKFALDKKYVFSYTAGSVRKGAAVFFLYALTAVLTTLVFWVVQWLFAVGFGFEGAKYAGGFLGLVMGYTLKYFLDKRFVFVDKK